MTDRHVSRARARTTAQPDPYSRFYWRFIDEYAPIYDDKPTFGWWLTLLVIAEGAHPSPAHLPRSIPRRTLDKLVDAGLVELGNVDRYRVKGVAAERTRRSDAARVAGLASGRSRRVEQTLNDPLNERSTDVERKSNLDETRLDETNNPQPPADARGNGVNPRALGTSPRQLAEAAANKRQAALSAVTWRYRRGEITAEEEQAERAAILGRTA